jgi:hypothetical protein
MTDATEILLGPVLTEGATTKVKDKKTGQVYYKKQILPEGKFTYKTADGKDIELDLTAAQHQAYVKSFKDKAYDEVPFQFGAHTNDPTIRKGTMADVEYVPGKGSWGYFQLDEEAAKYVEKYPNFGVSPRLVVGLKRMDGKTFPAAIQHVAGTVVPRASGMSPWEKIELSEDDMPDTVTIIDFSDETIIAHRDVKETPVTKTTGNGGNGGNQNSGETFTLSQEQYAFFTKMQEEYAKAEALLGEGDAPKEQEKVTVDLSEVTSKADKALAEIAQMRAAAVAETWAARKALLLSQGVPPAALDLADPVMTSVDSQVYDLSDGEGGTVKVDAKTQMLGQLELMKGMIDLGGELGHGQSGMVGSPDDTPENYDKWLGEYGLR